jgi:hypothetical protein
MLQAKLTLPELQTKKVWVGLYGGHYDVIVFFKEKPTPFEDSTKTDAIFKIFSSKNKLENGHLNFYR